MTALIFDCDGVLADTERDGHLVAFNQAFADLGIDFAWTPEAYGAMLSTGGGKERLAALMTDEFAQAHALPRVADRGPLVRQLHRRKTELYTELVAAGALPARRGIRRLISEAFAAGWQVAVASTSAVQSVESVVATVVPPELAGRIRIFAGDVVDRKKPAPDIYELAVASLDVDPDRAVVVEDSPIGQAAARAAGLACIVTTSDYTRGDVFPGADLVVSDLGEPGAPAIHVQANPHGVEVGDFVDLSVVEAVRSVHETTTEGATS